MTTTLHGVLAEFDDPKNLLDAARQAYGRGYRRLEAYTPFPLEGLNESIHPEPTRLPWIVFGGGLAGGLGGYLMQYYAMAISYPINVGGKPYHSWPAFIPVTFELTILAAALAAVLGMMVLNGFPEPYHPVFNVASFELASRDHFFLCIEARDKHFETGEVRRFLESLRPLGVYEVPE